MGLTEPAKEIFVEVLRSADADEMQAPPGPVFLGLHDPRALEPAPEGEVGQEVVFAGIEAGESNAGHGDEPRLLGNHLDVPQ